MRFGFQPQVQGSTPACLSQDRELNLFHRHERYSMLPQRLFSDHDQPIALIVHDFGGRRVQVGTKWVHIVISDPFNISGYTLPPPPQPQNHPPTPLPQPNPTPLFYVPECCFLRVVIWRGSGCF